MKSLCLPLEWQWSWDNRCPSFRQIGHLPTGALWPLIVALDTNHR